MVRFIAAFFLIVFFGCEMNSKQIIKPEKFTFESIKFNTVSKELKYISEINSPDHNNLNKIIKYWFDNRIKVDGFEGKLEIIVKEININRIKEKNYYKSSISLSMEFIEKISDTKINNFIVNVSEYGEIKGNFAIIDQENLDINLMHQSLEKVSSKLKEKN